MVLCLIRLLRVRFHPAFHCHPFLRMIVRILRVLVLFLMFIIVIAICIAHPPLLFD